MTRVTRYKEVTELEFITMIELSYGRLTRDQSDKCIETVMPYIRTVLANDNLTESGSESSDFDQMRRAINI